MTDYLKNGHTIIPAIALDDTLVKIQAMQGDGTYKWVHANNVPTNAVESLVWQTDGSIDIRNAGGILNVKNFGALGDGSTDDAAAFQTAITALQLTNGHILFIPPGVYIIKSTLTFNTAFPIIVQGTGALNSAGSILAWRGNATTPLMLLQGIRRSVFRDFAITAVVASPLLTAIQSDTVAVRVNSRNAFRGLFIGGAAQGDGSLGKGFAFTAGAGGNVNNDSMTFDHVEVNSTTTAAWSFEHAQSLIHNFFNCKATSGAIGVSTSLGSGSTGGSFSWYGGFTGANSTADFSLGAPPGGKINIIGCHSESSDRFLQTGGPGTAAFAVTINGVQYKGNLLNADGYAVVYKYAGPLVIRDSTWGNGETLLSRFSLSPNRAGRFVIEGNAFNGNNSVASTPYDLVVAAAGQQVFQFGNTYTNASNQVVLRADEMFGAFTPLTAGSGTGITLNNNSIGNHISYKITIDNTAWTAAQLVQDITVVTLPKKTMLSLFAIDTTIAFTGTAWTAATLQLGTAVAGFDLFSPYDVTVTGQAADVVTRILSWSATSILNLRLTSTGGNVSAITAGTVVIYVTGEVLP